MIPVENMRDSLRHQAFLVREVVRMNLEGMSHDDSLVQPQLAGNCANWVLGHLVAIYSKMMPMLGQQPAMSESELAHYARGSQPITSSSEAIPLERLQRAWSESCERVDAGLARVPDEMMGQRVADSPSGNPNETVASLLSTVIFHQAYHSGQLGTLRRLAGLPGAIK